MSNHGHLMVTDVEGRLPEFCEWMLRTIAQCINAVHGIRENVWSDGSYSAVRLETEESIVDKLAYVIANPVTAGLVREARQWPGVVSRPTDMYGAEHGDERPWEWFHERQDESAQVTMRAPPCFDGRVAELVSVVRDMVAERERLAAEELRRSTCPRRGARERGRPVRRPQHRRSRARAEPGVRGRHRLSAQSRGAGAA